MATQYGAVAAGVGNTVIKGSPGALGTIVVTTAGTGTGAVDVYDNATTNSGSIVFALPATVAVGVSYPLTALQVKNGITVANVANGPALTVWYD